MIKRDFHGYKLEVALREVEVIIGEVRQRGGIENAEFITGHGIIQKELFNLCKSYGLDTDINWVNAGVVDVTIE